MLTNPNEPVKLTQFAHGAGCGCKISPAILKEIIHSEEIETEFKNLLVGNQSNDDAAVLDLGNGFGLISSLDFFTPIVDDAYDFGRIAAANAISDVYAMGGIPNLALAILGWPINTLPVQLANEVLRGARSICAQVNIPLAGGHSIDSSEPLFGLSVNGMVALECLKKNNTATEGDSIFMTKAIGVGVLSTAQKRGLLKDKDRTTWIEQMVQINTIGAKIAKIKGVTAMTDITGFGLLGHLYEITHGSGLTANVSYSAIPKLDSLKFYLAQQTIPDATFRNWNAYEKHTHLEEDVNVMEAFQVLPDPQTNGGLLFTVKPESVNEVKDLLKKNKLESFCEPIGSMIKKGEKCIVVKK